VATDAEIEELLRQLREEELLRCKRWRELEQADDVYFEGLAAIRSACRALESAADAGAGYHVPGEHQDGCPDDEDCLGLHPLYAIINAAEQVAWEAREVLAHEHRWTDDGSCSVCEATRRA
jgi:hypothetical protein